MMRQIVLKQYATIILILPAIFLLVEGCVKPTAEQREPLPEIVWPQPPEKPRIRFVNVVSRPEDLQIKMTSFKRFLGYFSGKTDTAMVAPYGVATDSAGRLYVVDTALKTVHVFDVSAVEYYTFATKDSSFVSPIDIAIDDKRGYIYVSDSGEKAVKIFKDMGRVFVGEIGKGVLERPTGVAVNEKTSELLVVDTLNASILRYDLNDRSFKGILGGDGSAEGKFHYPTNIYVTKDGTILVSDSLNFRVQMFSSEGNFLIMFGSEGDQAGYFTRPRGVASDSDGNIYVVDALFDNIQIFNNQGRLLMAFGNHGRDYGEFWLPTGIFIDRNDMIYISDSYNKRIQIFKYLKGDDSLK
jgi:DNA-binding beta-propeller fold protein YncE